MKQTYTTFTYADDENARNYLRVLEFYGVESDILDKSVPAGTQFDIPEDAEMGIGYIGKKGGGDESVMIAPPELFEEIVKATYMDSGDIFTARNEQLFNALLTEKEEE